MLDWTRYMTYKFDNDKFKSVTNKLSMKSAKYNAVLWIWHKGNYIRIKGDELLNHNDLKHLKEPL